MSQADIGKVPRAKGKTFNKSAALRFSWRVKRDTSLNPPGGKLGVRTSKFQPTVPTRKPQPRLELG
jgi:hypothetical protein